MSDVPFIVAGGLLSGALIYILGYTIASARAWSNFTLMMTNDPNASRGTVTSVGTGSVVGEVPVVALPPAAPNDPNAAAADDDFMAALRKLAEDGEVIVKDGVAVIASATRKGYSWRQIGAAIAVIIGALGIGGGTTAVVNKMTTEPAAQVSPVKDPAPTPQPTSDVKWADVAKLFNAGFGKIDTLGVTLGTKIDASAEANAKGFKSLGDKIDIEPIPMPPVPVPKPPVMQTMLPVSIDAIPGQPSYLVAKIASGGKARWVVPPNTPAFVKEFDATLVIVPKAGATDFSVGIVSGAEGLLSEWCLIKCGVKPIPPPVDPPVPVTDAFTKAMQDAYNADGKPSIRAAQLAAIYKDSLAIVNDPAMKYEKDVVDAMHAKINTAIGSDLAKTRAAISAEMVSKIGTANKALTPDIRLEILTQFYRVQAALETLK